MPPSSKSSQRGAAHVGQRRLPADDFRDGRRDQRRVGLQLLPLLRPFVHGVDAAGHRVAGGVVAADDQQDQVAEIFLRRHVPRVLAMRQHRDEVAFRLGVDALVPQPREVAEAFQQLAAPLFLAGDDVRIVAAGRDVRPARQLAAILEREIEQRREHHGGELDRDLVDPVERLR